MKLSRLGRIVLIAFPIVTFGFSPAFAGPGLTTSAVQTLFASMAQASSLAHPSIILIDRANGNVVFEKDSVSLRRPASVMKLLSATSTLAYLNPESRYKTSVLFGDKPGTVILRGDFDPWMTASYTSARVDHRVWLNYLANRTISALKSQNLGNTKRLTIKYYGLYPTDVLNFRAYLKSQGVISTASLVPAKQVANLGQGEIVSATSPTIGEMLKFALLWSDNLLAERLARAAAVAAGNPMSDVGVSRTFHTMLANLQVDSAGLYAHDGSGLSKEDRVTAKIIGELLLKIRGNAKFSPLFGDLPVAGISGTLTDRFKITAPQAVGLVHAKTGTLDGTVSLAGYIESGQHEYVFVVIADQIPKGNLATDRARASLDGILGKIAAPLTISTPSPTPVVSESSSN
jgi:D-alanyl-D-alanine carboxypeptidase/D-alanyl-D-alanine-endopeptidase (penicillin-binding protein 4)